MRMSYFPTAISFFPVLYVFVWNKFPSTSDRYVNLPLKLSDNKTMRKSYITCALLSHVYGPLKLSWHLQFSSSGFWQKRTKQAIEKNLCAQTGDWLNARSFSSCTFESKSNWLNTLPYGIRTVSQHQTPEKRIELKYVKYSCSGHARQLLKRHACEAFQSRINSTLPNIHVSVGNLLSLGIHV